MKECIARGPILALACAWILCGCATGGRHDQQASRGDVLRATLSNGLRVAIVPNHLAPVATVEVNYLVGSNEVPASFPGTAHAQEHMMFRGSPGLAGDQLAKITASLGGDMDADTTQTVTQYYMTVPAENLDVALHVEAIRMKAVLDSESLWKKERGAIEQEVAADLSSPSYVLYSKLLGELFAGTPYAHDALGTRSSFERTSGAMLKKFHDQWYVPNNAVLVIAGDVDPRQTLSTITQLFGGIPAQPLPARPKIALQPVSPRAFKMPTDQPYGFVALAFRLPGYQSPDYAAAEVLSDILSSRRGPLYALVPQGKALYAGFEGQIFPETGIGFALAAFPKGANSAALAKTLKDTLRRSLKEGYSDDLLAAAKRQEATQLELGKTSVSGLASAWSNAIAVEGRDSPEDDVRAIQSVTSADLMRVAHRYLKLENAVEATLTPEFSGAPVSAKGYGGAESFASGKAKDVRLPAWAAKELARLEVPRSAVHPVVSTLPNGLRLIVQPETASRTVSIYGQVKTESELEAPQGKEGVADVLDQLFEYGTTRLDRIQFQKELDRIGASESAGAQFSIQALADHFDRAVELLADNELHPALPESAFQIVKQQLARSVDGRNRSPDYLAQRAALVSLVPNDDPKLRQATPQSVSSVSLNDVRSYYQLAFRPDLTTIVVIGNIDPEHARAKVEKNFGGWQAHGPKPQTDLLPVPLNRFSRTTVPDRARNQDKVTLAEMLGLTRSNPDYYALQLGNHVLGGGFYATRLYHDLREELGLVYYVGSDFQIKKTRAAYVLTYACDPPKVSKARAVALRDLEQMRKVPVNAFELRQAKGILLRDISLAESSEQSIARGLIDRSLNELPLDEPTLAAKRYLAMSGEQVRAAFNKWLDPARLIEVVQGPPPK